MLKALKDFSGSRDRRVHDEGTELEWLINRSIEERRSIQAMLVTLMASAEKLTPLTQSLEDVTEQMAFLKTQLDNAARRIGALDERTQDLDAFEKRCQALEHAAQ